MSTYVSLVGRGGKETTELLEIENRQRRAPRTEPAKWVDEDSPYGGIGVVAASDYNGLRADADDLKESAHVLLVALLAVEEILADHAETVEEMSKLGDEACEVVYSALRAYRDGGETIDMHLINQMWTDRKAKSSG